METLFHRLLLAKGHGNLSGFIAFSKVLSPPLTHTILIISLSSGDGKVSLPLFDADRAEA